MRKKVNVIVCIIIAVCVFAFAVACQPKDADGLIKLSAPKNLALNGGSLSWDEVKNAQEYFISIDGKEIEKSTNSTTYDLSTAVVGYGNFSIAVRAYGDGKKYGSSDKSKPIVFHKGNMLNTPVVSVENAVASWSEVEFAVNYSIRVTNSSGIVMDECVISELSYNFAEKTSDSENESGETQSKKIYEAYSSYKIFVIANPAEDNADYSPSLAGVATYNNSTTLSTPKFTYMTGTTIRWETVSNASGYILRKTYEDGTYEDSQELTGTSYAYRSKFNLEKVGKYYFTIKANGDNQVYYSSEFSEKDEEYSLNKLESLQSENVALKYEGEAAKLSWKVPASSLAEQVTLNLRALLPNGEQKLESTLTEKIISNKVKFVEGDVYDFYKYDGNGDVVKVNGDKIVLYDMDGYAKVRYNGDDYFLKDKSGSDILWKSYAASAGVDIICDMSGSDLVFVNDARIVNDNLGKLVSQKTNEKEAVNDSDGGQMYFFEKVDGESDLDVERKLEYDGGDVAYHTFVLYLDEVFFKETTEESGGKSYKYLLKDQYYGLLYDVSLSLDTNSKNFVVSESVKTEGQYLSYKIPERDADNANAFVVKNAGEYAYIIINSFINENNTDKFSIEEDINFNGYELAQIDTFKGHIDGNKHTISGIVIGNKIMSEDGVVKNGDEENIRYSMFCNIQSDGNATHGLIENVFYVGMGFVGYDKEDISEDTKSILVAPIAVNNGGTIRNVLVQSDGIKAEGADVAGLVVNNNAYINSTFVYAQLDGRNVGGVILNNASGTAVVNCGFNGKITSEVGEILTEGVTSIMGAGFVVKNSGMIANSFAVGEVSVSAKSLDDDIYAGGFAAVNEATISNSYSGEFTLNNIVTNVIANGDRAYAGGFVGRNSGSVTSCYATNTATASLYVGGFVGYNEGSVGSSYATGGTARSGVNRGAFVGGSVGQISDSVCYSTDSWAEDGVVEVLNKSSELATIYDKLYPSGNGDMFMLNADADSDKEILKRGYHTPILKDMIYIYDGDSQKDNIVTTRPSVVDLKVEGVIYISEVNTAEYTPHGNFKNKGNRIVVELKQGSITRYVYGYII